MSMKGGRRKGDEGETEKEGEKRDRKDEEQE